MKSQTVTRVLLGLMFIAGGAVKTKRFGKLLSRDAYIAMTDIFPKALELFPVELKPDEFQEIVGFTELICGFLLMNGVLVGPASSVLVVVMLGAFYTLHKLNHPSVLVKISPLILAAFLLTKIIQSRDERLKQD